MFERLEEIEEDEIETRIIETHVIEDDQGEAAEKPKKVKNYEYGLLPPTLNADLVVDQMHLGHRYRNKLVEVERDRRARVSTALVGHPDVSALAARVDDFVERLDDARTTIKAGKARIAFAKKTARALEIELKAARTALKTRPGDPALTARVADLAARHDAARATIRAAQPQSVALREAARALGAELGEARAILKAAKQEIAEDVQVAAQIEAIDATAAQAVRDARAACGTYWSSYLIVEQAMDASRKAPTPPSFLRWTGDGRVSVQLQGGLDLPDAWGTDTQFRIDPVSPDAHDESKPRGVRRRAQRTILRMRVQSTDKGKPIWAEWPMIMHRPIPPGARIKVATVSRRRRDCRRWDWRLLLTLDLSDAIETKAAVPADGMIALNLGWRQMTDAGVRAGYLVSEDGKIDRQVLVPPSTIDRVEKSEKIRSQRDQNLDQLKAALVPWLRDRDGSLPAWLEERAILSRERPGVGVDASAESDAVRRRSWHVAMWRSASRFRGLAFTWRDRRWEGDEVGYQLIEAWRYRDEHLQRYEAALLRQGLADRREGYRIFAADLPTHHRIFVIDNTDLRKFQRTPTPESGKVERPTAKRNQRHAAGSELRATIIDAFGGLKGDRVRKVFFEKITMPCHDCGQIDDWDPATSLMHTCSSCGLTWDQDRNACLNLLALARRDREEAPSPAPAPAPRKETRSERLRRSRWKDKAGA